jgi:O-antigen/teichoic acid export membrane protein
MSTRIEAAAAGPPGLVPGAAAEPGPAARSLLRGAYSLAANTVVTASLGFVFWVIAARLFSDVEVGRDTVLISAMVELSTICQLNLGNGIVRFVPGLGRGAPRALALAYLVTGLVAVAVGTAFVVAAPKVSSEFGFLGARPALQVAFVAALVLWGVFALQDAALTATRRAIWVPIENGTFGLLKLIALVPVALVGVAHGIFLAWAVPMALLVVPVNWLLFKRALPGRAREGSGATAISSRPERRRVGRFLAQDYLASLFTQATMTALPILVLSVVGAAASAWFAIPFMVVVAFDTLAYGTCTALVAEASLEGESPAELARLFATRVVAPLVPVTLALIALAPLILRVFGPTYAEHGTTVLRLLLAASLLRLALALFAALARIHGRALRIAAVELGLLVLALGTAVPMAHARGIEGVAIAWLGANLVAAACVAPALFGELRRSSSGPAARTLA